METDRRLNLAVLISGGGTTLKNLITRQRQGRLPVEFSLVVSTSPQAAGNQHAVKNGIKLLTVERRKFDSDDAFSDVIFGHCDQWQVDLVVMAGFLKKVVVPQRYENRVINIHPSLIPDFCGKGMYGMHVHRAVIASQETVSGCTVHFVDNEYDHGPIIAQEKVPVLEDDSAESLQRRVFASECDLYPAVITAIAQGTLKSTH